MYKGHHRAASINQIIYRLGVSPTYLDGLLICNNTVFESLLLTPLHQPMGPWTLIFMKEPYVHLLAIPLYMEVLSMASMLGQFIVLRAGG